MLRNVAPSGQVVAYDRQNLAVYAALLDADAAGIGWVEGARSILGLDDKVDSMTAQGCWESHLARARWITGEGLSSALRAFDQSPQSASPHDIS
ncbi:hypothetical protein EWH10_18585 [Sphingobium fuliginis]|nr:hypothetical protein EWH10_18585 [Sphingobium fuliginis]